MNRLQFIQQQSLIEVTPDENYSCNSDECICEMPTANFQNHFTSKNFLQPIAVTVLAFVCSILLISITAGMEGKRKNSSAVYCSNDQKMNLITDANSYPGNEGNCPHAGAAASLWMNEQKRKKVHDC